MSETGNNMKERKTRISKLSIWVVIIVAIVCIAIVLCVALQILAVKTLLICGAIFLPVIFFSRLLYEIILIFRKK